MMTKRCTCGPHPRINLTDAYLEYNRRANRDNACAKAPSSSFDDVSKQIKAACQSHGCFHVKIRHRKFTADCDVSSQLQSLAMSQSNIEDDIESLFSQSFLNAVLSNECDASGSTDNPLKWNDICNSRTLEVSLYNNSNDCSDDVQCGTFRGRYAESGDEQNPRPEPKLSWEFPRCSLTGKHITVDKKISSDVDVHKQWRLLPQYAEALHSVAATVIHFLGIPPGVVLREEQCGCVKNSNEKLRNYQQHKCNIDLLRVFRYDSTEENDFVLGSSAHSDWGTLTVVWQDDKGGLQTYCEACDKWSDVDTAASFLQSASNDDTWTDVCINLFVHIGDFLSLATMQRNGFPQWHSPRHRVLCPMRSSNDASTDNQCRRSLVYFAYPPPGISLKNAQKVVNLCVNSPQNNTLKFSHQNFNMYSVLHNQSASPVSSTGEGPCIADYNELADEMTRISYKQILDDPFDEVIAKKWAQVQRNH